MSLLFRYLTRSNLFLMFVLLFAGIGIYIITDLFERLDDFIEAGVGAGNICLFFLAKIPNIISQILPAVFLIALIVQLNILIRNNETIALWSGGISPMVILRFVIFHGLFWALLQLLFSQVIGVQAEYYTSNMWDNLVKQKERRAEVHGLWFSEGKHIIHLDYADALIGQGQGFIAYELSDDGLRIKKIIEASTFNFKKGEWLLKNGSEAKPEEFTKSSFAEKPVFLEEDLQAFVVMETTHKPAYLPLWELGTIIKRLQAAGSNVEALRVAWHAKLAYAFSIIVLGFYGLAVSQVTSNIYKAVGSGVLIIFIYYAFTTMGNSLGEKGIIAPMAGTWAPTLIGSAAALIWLCWPYLSKKNN